MSLAELARFIAAEPDFDTRWRLVVELLKEYHREAAHTRHRLLADAPGPTGDERWDVLFAGLAEHLAMRDGGDAPAWSASRGLRRFWFPVVTSVAVKAPRELALLCTGQGYTGHTDKTVYVSGDLGATWKLAGHPASSGDGGMIDASAPGHLTIATTSSASWLYYSADNGKTWHAVLTYPDGGQGWNDLGFTTTRDGVIIHGHPYYGDMLGRLLLTDNGGPAWRAVTF